MSETRESHHENKQVQYVVCLLFSDDLTDVCLIKKNRPEWQKGLLNGIGGKIEPNESTLAACIRGFAEETGVEVTDWKLLCFQEALNKSYLVYYFVAKDSAQLFHVRSTTDEQVGAYTVKYIDTKDLVSSMSWVIPMAVYALSGKMDKEYISVNIW